MVAAHDDLFCTLAVRNGIFTREVGLELLERFRSEPRRKVGIAQFAVAEGFVDEAVAAKIEHAIAMRADGHVVEHAKTKHGKNHGHGHGHALGHAHGHQAHGQAHGHGAMLHHHEKPLSQNQIMVAVGALLIIVLCVILLIFTLNQGGPERPSTSRDSAIADETTSESTSGTSSTAVRKPFLPAVKEPPRKRQYSAEERAQLDVKVEQARGEAARDKADGKFHYAVRTITRTREDLGGEVMPDEVLSKFSELEKEYQGYLDKEFAERAKRYRDAKAADDKTLMDEIAQEIEYNCGPEKRKEAEASAK